MNDMIHKVADGELVYDIDHHKIGTGEEFSVGVSRITKELNDLRVAVQGLYGGLLDYSGLQVEQEDRRRRLPGRRPLKHKSADLDKLTENTFDAMRKYVMQARAVCGSYAPDDEVDLVGYIMLRELCDNMEKCRQSKHWGVLLAHRWWYADGLLRNKRLLTRRAEGVQKWREALVECERNLEA